MAKADIDGKAWEQLWEADQHIRQLFPANPQNAPSSQLTVLATIEVIGGFEAFNTRPHHNYETWGQGYRISSQGVVVEAEDLDIALERWRKSHEQAIKAAACPKAQDWASTRLIDGEAQG